MPGVQPVTPADIKALAAAVGGVRALAKRLGVSKDWLYRRINGETPIREVDIPAMERVRRKKKRS